MKVIYDVKDRVARITINRPEAMNAMDPDVYAGLSTAWTDVRDNPDVWVGHHHGGRRESVHGRAPTSRP